MGIRTTGLISNMDTESIIKELMNAQSLKKTKVENKITKLEWKQEKWKDLNTKIYALYTESLSKLKLESTYLSKKGTSSNEDKIKVSASTTAAEGTHVVTVSKLASSQYVTSGAMSTYISYGEELEVSSSSRLTELGFSQDGSTVINIQSEGKEAVELAVDEDTTVYDFLESCKEAGLNASYDTTQKRFFISSKSSGAEGAFSITANKSSAAASREALKDVLNYDNLTAADKDLATRYIDDFRAAVIANDDTAKITAQNELSDIASNTIINRVEQETETAYRASLASPDDFSQESLDALISDALSSTAVTDELTAKAAALSTALTSYETAVDGEVLSTTDDNGLANLKLENITYSIANGEVTYGALSSGSAVSLLQAANGAVTYNGATLTGTSNTYSVAGLSFTANATTGVGETITLSVAKDTDTAYASIKSFVTQYNELIKEMNTYYYASSATGYDVLTDEERDTMTDEQIEKWETKIKDSLLRRDDKLGTLLSSLKTTASSSVTVNDQSYALSTYGITTDAYTEKGLLHIYGDSTDTVGSAKTDKLKTALETDPDTVIAVLTQVADNLYSTMSDQMKSSSINSALKFYNDKQLDKTMKEYKEELSILEDRLTEVEDRYYDQFTAMETAMSKLNSQQSSLSSLLGTSNS